VHQEKNIISQAVPPSDITRRSSKFWNLCGRSLIPILDLSTGYSLTLARTHFCLTMSAAEEINTMPTIASNNDPGFEMINLRPLMESAIDSHGQRSMAFQDNVTGARTTQTAIVKHLFPGPDNEFMRAEMHKIDRWHCACLFENLPRGWIRTCLSTVAMVIVSSVLIIHTVLGIKFLALRDWIRQSRINSTTTKFWSWVWNSRSLRTQPHHYHPVAHQEGTSKPMQ
jgi:hypothetical protein